MTYRTLAESGLRPFVAGSHEEGLGSRLRLARWLIWPAVLFTLLFFVAPLIAMLCVSFWSRENGALIASWSWANYQTFFHRPYLMEAFVNSVVVTFITTAISILVAYPLAYYLAYRIPARWQRLILIITILPFWTSYVVRSYSWLLVLGDNGMINQALLAIGLIKEPIKIAYSRAGTVLGFVHFFVMLLTLTIYANLIQINPSYRRAAQDLGASALRVFVHITLPLSLPGVAVGAFLTFVVVIGDYITPQILGGNTEMLMPQAIMLQLIRTANLPMASMMGILLMSFVTLIYVIFQRHLKMDRL